MELGGGVFIFILLFTLLEALSGPCSNGGTAVGDGCVCPPGRSSHRCETPDPAGACRNGGTAVGTSCYCPPGFGGPRCQHPDPASACRNGAAAFGTTCVCPPGFRGDTCQDLEELGSCLNGGTLEKGTCRCPPTAWGPRCECTGTATGKVLYVNGSAGTNDTVTVTTAGGDAAERSTDAPPARREGNVTGRSVEGNAVTGGNVTGVITNGSVTGRSRAVTAVVSANTDRDAVTTTERDTVVSANTVSDVVIGTDRDAVTTIERDTVVSANTVSDVVIGTDRDVVTTIERDTVVSANTVSDVVIGTDRDVVTTTERDTVVRRNVPMATTTVVSTTTPLVRNVTDSAVGSHARATTAEGETTAVEGDTTVTLSNLVEGDTTAVEGDTMVTEGDAEATPMEGDTEATPVATTVSNTRATTVESDTVTTPMTAARGHTKAMENNTRATTLKSDTRATTLESHPVSPANVTSTPAPPNATEATGALGHLSAGTSGDFLTLTTTSAVTDGTYGDFLTLTTTSPVTTVATICLYLPHGSSPPSIVCHNGGVANRTHCLCPPGYSGPTCETPDPNDRCADGSTAVGDRCICPPGRTGPRCATLDPATSCRHGGTAVGTECYCPPGFSGLRCEDPNPTTAPPVRPPRRTRATPRTARRTTTTTVPTTRDPCMNGGLWNGVACLCPPNMDGARCEFGASTINLTAELGPFVTMMARVTNRDFSEDMGDVSSPGHRRFAEEFSRTMDGIYRNVSGYRGINVLSLSRGSVVVNYRVQLWPLPGNASLDHRARELLALANAASRPHNCSSSADGLCFTATSARATRAATLPPNATELCRRHAPANFSRFYFPYRTANGLLCITNCTLNVPGSFDCHRGLCRLTLEGPQCFCPDLPWYLSTGDRCQTHISKLGLGLGVGLGLGLTILILLILCIVLTVRLTQGRKKSPGASPSPLKLGRLHSVAAEDSWPDGGRNSRVTGIYHVNGRGGGAGKGPYNTYKPSSEVAEPPASVLAEGAAVL